MDETKPQMTTSQNQIRQVENGLDNMYGICSRNFEILQPVLQTKYPGLDLSQSIVKLVIDSWIKEHGMTYAKAEEMTKEFDIQKKSNKSFKNDIRETQIKVQWIQDKHILRTEVESKLNDYAKRVDTELMAQQICERPTTVAVTHRFAEEERLRKEMMTKIEQEYLTNKQYEQLSLDFLR